MGYSIKLYNYPMDKNKTLILIEVNESNDIFYNDWLKHGYKASTLFKRVSKPLRAIRRIWLENNLFNSSMWYGGWFNELDKYDTLIINMSYLTRYMPFIINKKYPKLRIICWYWNTIDNKTLPIETNNANIEYWSFDKNDCDRYNLHNNVQYYCWNEDAKNNEIESGIYFVGREKGRSNQINEIKDIASKQGLVCNFNVIVDDVNNYIPYTKVREDISKSKAILEINKDNQDGFTLRVLESLFYGKKLITNNKSIRNSIIYNKDNVFIIGEDNIDELKEFINKPYNHNVDKYKNDYELDAWFNNFGK